MAGSAGVSPDLVGPRVTRDDRLVGPDTDFEEVMEEIERARAVEDTA